MTTMFALLWIFFIHTVAIRLLKSKPLTIKISIIVICLVLVIYKAYEYSIQWSLGNYQKMPVEFSAVTYFLFGITFLFSFKPLKPFVAFAAFLSGFGYLIVFPFTSTHFIIINGFESTFIALISHSLLYLGSLLVMKTEVLPKTTRQIIMIWTLVIVVYQVGMRFLIPFENEYLFIYIILEGRAIHQIIEQSELVGIIYFVYFMSIWLIYYILATIFYQISQKVYHKYDLNLTKHIKGEKKHEHTI